MSDLESLPVLDAAGWGRALGLGVGVGTGLTLGSEVHLDLGLGAGREADAGVLLLLMVFDTRREVFAGGHRAAAALPLDGFGAGGARLTHGADLAGLAGLFRRAWVLCVVTTGDHLLVRAGGAGLDRAAAPFSGRGRVPTGGHFLALDGVLAGLAVLTACLAGLLVDAGLPFAGAEMLLPTAPGNPG